MININPIRVLSTIVRHAYEQIRSKLSFEPSLIPSKDKTFKGASETQIHKTNLEKPNEI